MNKDDYLAWLLNWFNKHVAITKDAIACNFFTEGWIDSFKTLELITEMESNFNIHFDDAVFSDPRFSTILGLSEIISELKHTNQPN